MVDRLKQIRKSLRDTQHGMSSRLGLGVSTWQKYELGKNVPGLDVVRKLVEAGFDANWILTGEGEMRLDGVVPAGSMTGKGLDGYPEIGAEDVLEVLDLVEKRLHSLKMTVDPKKKAELIRLVCEVMIEEDREAWSAAKSEGKLVELKSVDRILRLVG
jgi:transcriptional regulator with XRE-family HTH domain